MEHKENIQKLKKFLSENFSGVQAFTTRNIIGDLMETVYESDGIVVDYCELWEYVEIFGIPEEDFEELTCKKDGFVGRYVK